MAADGKLSQAATFRRGQRSHVVRVALSRRPDLYVATGDHADRSSVTTHRDGHRPRRHQAYREACARGPSSSRRCAEPCVLRRAPVTGCRAGRTVDMSAHGQHPQDEPVPN